MFKAIPRATLIMLVASVALNVVLAHKLRQFNHLLGDGSEHLLKSGSWVPAFEATDLRGQRQSVAYNQVSKPTVLYIFTPPCNWCARNMENIKTLVSKESPQYRFIGISLSDQAL